MLVLFCPDAGLSKSHKYDTAPSEVLVNTTGIDAHEFTGANENCASQFWALILLPENIMVIAMMRNSKNLLIGHQFCV